MSKIYMLTKTNCPNCSRLKLHLKTVLNDKYQNDITIVDKEKDYDLFFKLAKKHLVLTLPVLIKDDDILIDMHPKKIKFFIEKHIRE